MNKQILNREVLGTRWYIFAILILASMFFDSTCMTLQKNLNIEAPPFKPSLQVEYNALTQKENIPASEKSKKSRDFNKKTKNIITTQADSNKSEKCLPIPSSLNNKILHSQSVPRGGGGCILYAKNPTDNKIYLLFGFDEWQEPGTVHPRAWTLFYGKFEASDNGSFEVAAAREAAEESMYLMDDDFSFEVLCKVYDNNLKVFPLPAQQSCTYNYYLRTIQQTPQEKIFIKKVLTASRQTAKMKLYPVCVNYDPDIQKQFALRRRIHGKNIPACFKEKKKVRWFKLDDLIQSFEKNTQPVDIIVNKKRIYRFFAELLLAPENYQKMVALNEL